MSARICLHGHFYQPPREDPWTGAVPGERSARPWRNWNRKITSQCYAPMAGLSWRGAGRKKEVPPPPLLPRMSFNFGPTLLAWMEREVPEVYRAVLEADRRGADLDGSFGPAMAQAYNHLILPLAKRRDKEIQVAWGLRDFRNRFGRETKGLWLPETAADLETLDAAAGAGVEFVILSSHQVILPPGEEADPGKARRIPLPGGLSLACFLIDPELFQGLTFRGLAAKGEELARLWASKAETRNRGIVLAAVDGEYFGHHTRKGPWELDRAFSLLEGRGIERVLPARLLEEEGTAGEARLRENTSWSCPHGVERWRGHCGCRAGGPASWRQDWKAPLREALETLRDEAARLWEEETPSLLKNPWNALLEGVDLFPGYPSEKAEAWLAAHGRPGLTSREGERALLLLEIQRLTLFSLTSCGFFFDDLTGLEPLQNLRFAKRALEILERLGRGKEIRGPFLETLARSRSNKPGRPDAARLFAALGPGEILSSRGSGLIR